MTTEENFNPRFPRGKRLTDFQQGIKELIFQSTLPAGEATGKGIKIDYMDEISIHASRGGSDLISMSFPFSVSYFNPRFPRGKRHLTGVKDIQDYIFQSTLPAGEATELG